METSQGKVPNLEICKASCEIVEGCKSISYFKTGWCSHWSTLCEKTKRNKKVLVSLRTKAEPRTWIEVGAKRECHGYTNGIGWGGEIYMESSPGKVASLEACKKSCENNRRCKSISYFNTKWCSHWDTPCTETRYRKKVAMSLRLMLNSEIIVNGGWSAFSACSVSCAGGIQTRTCSNPAPEYGGTNCTGDATRACNTFPCPGKMFCMKTCVNRV